MDCCYAAMAWRVPVRTRMGPTLGLVNRATVGYFIFKNHPRPGTLLPEGVRGPSKGPFRNTHDLLDDVSGENANPRDLLEAIWVSKQ